MAYSRHEYPYTGGSPVFAIDFTLGYLNDTDVTAYIEGEVDGGGAQVLRSFTWDDAYNIRMTDALPNPCVVIIDRTVSKDQLVIDASGSGKFTQATLIKSVKQLMMSVHELLDGRVDEFTNTDVIQGYVTLAQSAMDAAGVSATDADADATAAAASAVVAAAEAVASANSASASSASSIAAQAALDELSARVTVSTADPSGGAEGHIWFKYIES